MEFAESAVGVTSVMEASPSLPASGWRGLRAVLADHWSEYLIEGAALGLFMISAGLLDDVPALLAKALRDRGKEVA